MNLIGIETSTENCSVALLHDGKLTTRDKIAPQKHAELVLGYLDELLSEACLKKSQVDGIVFGQGPGAFTGVRIAMSIVQGLALALEVPVIAISTMKNMAYQVWQQNPESNQKLLIANDARMGEVYWAAFESVNGQLLRLSEDALNKPEEVKTQGFDVLAGSALQNMIQNDSGAQILPETLPNARSLLELASHDFSQHAQHINQIKPSYIREKVVFN